MFVQFEVELSVTRPKERVERKLQMNRQQFFLTEHV